MKKDRQPLAPRPLLAQVETALRAVLGKRMAVLVVTGKQEQPTLKVGREAVFSVDVTETAVKNVGPWLAVQPRVLVAAYVSNLFSESDMIFR